MMRRIVFIAGVVSAALAAIAMVVYHFLTTTESNKKKTEAARAARWAKNENEYDVNQEGQEAQDA